MTTIKTRLRHTLVDALDLPVAPGDVPDTDLLARLGLDSLACLTYLIAVEKAFGIVIDDDDMSADLVDDLDALAHYVAGRVERS